MRIRKVLAGLGAAVLATTVSTFVFSQPASAVEYLQRRVYSYNTYLAGAAKSMAVLSASTANGAHLIQYTPNGAAPDNDWMILEIEPSSPVAGTTLMRIKPAHTFSNDGNPHNDKCLAISGAQSGYNRQIVNWTCSYDSINNDVWLEEIVVYGPTSTYVSRFRNLQHRGSCIVVQNASTANGAKLITHACDGGGPNHYWVW